MLQRVKRDTLERTVGQLKKVVGQLSDEETALSSVSLRVVMKETCFIRACNDVNRTGPLRSARARAWCGAAYSWSHYNTSHAYTRDVAAAAATAARFSLSSTRSRREPSGNNYTRIQDSLSVEPVRAQADIH